MAKRKRVYRAHPRAAYDDNLAQWIGEQVEKHGDSITPEQFIAACKPAKSPGHGLFNWNIEEAARAHWIERAQYHLRHVEIEIVGGSEDGGIRACIPVYDDPGTPGAGRSYVSYDRIRETPNLARQVVEQAAHELKAWQRRYALYKSVFGSVFLAIEQLENEVWPQQQSTASRKTAKRQTARQKAAS